MNNTSNSKLLVVLATAFLLLACTEKGVLTAQNGTTGTTGTTGTLTTDFSNIVLKSHIPKEISDGAGGVLTTGYQGFTMGNSDASIVYDLAASDTTSHLFKIDASNPVELATTADPAGYSFMISGDGTKILSYNGVRDIIDYTSGTLQAIGAAAGAFLPYTITDAGDLVAFWSRKDLAGGNAGLFNQLFTLTTDGSEVYNQITSFGIDYLIEKVTISGDGSKIFFYSTDDVLGDGSNADGSQELFSIDSNGTNLSQHTTLDSGFISEIRVSTDGGMISTVLSNYNSSTTNDLYTINTATDVLTYITDLSQASRDYDLSADGNTIAYVYTDSVAGTRVISLVNTDGTLERSVLVTTTVGGLNSPHINTDGTQITFDSGIDFGKGVTIDETVTQIYTLTVI
ncbi:MAG: hypothetical protein ABUK13_07135 [Gammaproteobacteria bacterium]